MSRVPDNPSPPLKRIKGPTAYEGNPRRFVYLAWTIAYTEFRANYFGSVLGPAWALLRPLMLFGVLYLVFTHVIRFGDEIENYPAVLLMNLVLFNFFSDATLGSLTSVVRHENVVRKMQFPRMVIPVASVITAGLYLVQNLVAVSIFLVIAGVSPRVTWLLVPILVLGFVVLASGVAMLLSSLYPRFRDVYQIWVVVSTMLLYGSPVLYTVTIAPAAAQKILTANPIGALLTQARKWVIDPAAPGVAEVLGSPWLALVPVGAALGIFGLGLWVFNHEAPGIAERL